MGNKILSMADHFVNGNWHLSLKEISPIDECQKIWREIQSASAVNNTVKIESSLSLGVERGERNHKAFELSRMMRDAEYIETETLSELQKWNQLNCPPITPIGELRSIVRSTYRNKPINKSSRLTISVLDVLRNEVANLNLSVSEHTALTVALSLTNTVEKIWEGYTIKPGELILSHRSLSERANVKKCQVRSMLSKAKRAGYIQTIVLGNRRATLLTWIGPFAKIFNEIARDSEMHQLPQSRSDGLQADSPGISKL